MSNARSRAVLSIVFVAIVVLAGCGGAGGGAASGGGGGGGGGGDGGAAPAEIEAQTQVARSGGAGGGGGGGGSDASAANVQARALIQTGRVSLEVERFDRARQNITQTTERYGGFVSDSRREVHRVDNKTYTTGELVLRVPQTNFSTVMDRVQAEGKVLEASTSTEDVTDQLVDLEARLRNLKAERDQLRELYKRANTTEDVLAVQRRLSDVQEEIERVEARKQSLERRVALSTIRVELREPRPEPDPDPIEQWYDVPVVKAFLDSVDGVVVTLRALVVLVAYALPYLVVFGIPITVVAYLVWRRRTGHSFLDGWPPSR